MKRSFLWFALLPALAGCGAAPPEDDASEFANARDLIVNGTTDSETTGVVGLAITFGSGANPHCSGTLIAPNLVITARHCVALPADGNFGGAVICGSSGFRNPAPGQFIGAYTSTQFPPTQEQFFQGLAGPNIRAVPGGNDTCGFDVALMILDEPVPPEVATPIVPRIDSNPQPGEGYSALGYGRQGNNPGFGVRMRLDGNEVICSEGSCPSFFQTLDTEWVGNSRTCGGDSGGPAIDEEGRVTGVLSRGPEATCFDLSFSPLSTYGSVGAWGDFIIETANEAAEVGGYDPPFWAVTGQSLPPDELGNPCGRCLNPDFQCFDEDEDGEGICVPGCGFDGDCPTDFECNASIGLCVPVPDPIGESCDGTCANGFRCFAPSGEPPGTCVPPCDETTVCPNGFSCDLEFAGGTCLPDSNAEGTDAGSTGGCAISTDEPTSPAWLLLLAGLVRVRRRRRSPR